MKIILSFFIIFLTIASVFRLTMAKECNRLKHSNESIFPLDKKHQSSIRIISYNIRGESLLDREHNNAWNIRKHKIQYLLQSYQPDIIGLQEVRTIYISDLLTLFPEYTCIAFDTSKEDKDVALLIRTSRFKIEKQHYFWLSDNPNAQGIPEASWDARKPRIVVYVKLFDQLTNKTCVIFCTHFDSVGIDTRVKSVQVLMQEQQKIAPSLPVIIMGDLNLSINPLIPNLIENNENAYKLLVNQTTFSDIRDFIESKHHGPDGSWIGWPYDKYAVSLGMIGERLDHMFVQHCQVIQEGVLNLKVTNDNDSFIAPSDNNYKDILYPSDHLPIIADIIFL